MQQQQVEQVVVTPHATMNHQVPRDGVADTTIPGDNVVSGVRNSNPNDGYDAAAAGSLPNSANTALQRRQPLQVPSLPPGHLVHPRSSHTPLPPQQLFNPQQQQQAYYGMMGMPPPAQFHNQASVQQGRTPASGDSGRRRQADQGRARAGTAPSGDPATTTMAAMASAVQAIV